MAFASSLWDPPTGEYLFQLDKTSLFLCNHTSVQIKEVI